MGFRTVVVLFNDQASEWKTDQALGENIYQAMHDSKDRQLSYGRVVECVHADTQTLGILHDYQFTPLAHTHWHRQQTANDRAIELLKQAADSLGYCLVKKT